jgi:hypothetical protein
MIRAAVAALALSGCSVVEHVQVLPVINPTTYDVSCCVAYVELNRSTSGSLEVQKSAANWSVSTKLRFKF